MHYAAVAFSEGYTPFCRPLLKAHVIIKLIIECLKYYKLGRGKGQAKILFGVKTNLIGLKLKMFIKILSYT